MWHLGTWFCVVLGSAGLTVGNAYLNGFLHHTWFCDFTASQHDTWEERFCQTNSISFSDEITSLVDKVNCIDTIDLGFYKALGLGSQNFLIKKLALCNINKEHFQLIRNWLDDRSHSSYQWWIIPEEGVFSLKSTQIRKKTSCYSTFLSISCKEYFFPFKLLLLRSGWMANWDRMV